MAQVTALQAQDPIARRLEVVSPSSEIIARRAVRPILRVGLVACCGRKHSAPVRAQDLYASPLFRKSRAYVEANCDEWAILSAKHGVVLPWQVIAPYDRTLNGLDVDDYQQWCRSTECSIRMHFQIWVQPTEFVVLAGAKYRGAMLIAGHLPHVTPMAGLGIGQQLAWLTDALRPPSEQLSLGGL